MPNEPSGNFNAPERTHRLRSSVYYPCYGAGGIFLAALFAVGVVIACLVAISIPSWYTSEVVLQARLPRQDPQLQSEVSLDDAGELYVTDDIGSMLFQEEVCSAILRTEIDLSAGGGDAG